MRTVVLGEQIVPYRLERSSFKTVGMMVDAQGLRVRASPYVSVSEISEFCTAKRHWILRHLSPSPRTDTPVATAVSCPIYPWPMAKRSGFWGERFRYVGDGAAIAGCSVERAGFGSNDHAPAQVRVADIRASYQNALANALGDYLLAYLHQRAQWYAQHHGLRYRDIVLSMQNAVGYVSARWSDSYELAFGVFGRGAGGLCTGA